MRPVIGQAISSSLFEIAFTAALVVGALLLVGVVISLAMFAYQSVRGEGMKDPRESTAGSPADGESELQEGNHDDEWDYY
jgi:hypothetical protein